MSKASITIHKTVETDSTYVPSLTLKMSVTTAEGVTPCIFVHEYQPKNPTSAAKFEFMNVAYYDELTEVPDYLEFRNKSCLIRKSELEKRFSDREAMYEFIKIVGHDIQRLLQQVETTTATGECEDMTFTADTVKTEIVRCLDREETQAPEDSAPQPAADTIILSFDGK